MPRGGVRWLVRDKLPLRSDLRPCCGYMVFFNLELRHSGGSLVKKNHFFRIRGRPRSHLGVPRKHVRGAAGSAGRDAVARFVNL